MSGLIAVGADALAAAEAEARASSLRQGVIYYGEAG